MPIDSPSRWERFKWHPAVPALLAICNAFFVIRGPSFLNVAALVMCVIYFGWSLAIRYQARRAETSLVPDSSESDEAERDWHDRKSAIMEAVLGEEHHSVMHAMIPYAVGGALDLYYYPNGRPGVAIATKELSPNPGAGPSNAAYRQFELVMFTKKRLDLDAAKDERTEFGRAHRSISAVLNHLAPYSERVTLNPGETLEFPEDMERVGGKCLIFDSYGRGDGGNVEDFGVLAVIEIYRSEMEYAREHGGAVLLDRLKYSGVYPYSDLDREPVA